MFESSKVKAASVDAVASGGSLSKHATGKALGTFPADAGYGRIVALQKKWSVSNYIRNLCLFLRSSYIQHYVVYFNEVSRGPWEVAESQILRDI